MAATIQKNFHVQGEPGATHYVRVLRMYGALNQWLDADGLFTVPESAGASGTVSLTEASEAKGLFLGSENRAPWPTGDYLVLYFQQQGETPSVENDLMIEYRRVTVKDDRLVD